MSSPIVVAISGRARAGKDTAANVLALHGFRRIALADAVKSALRDLGDDAMKSLPDGSVRRGWQILGTECREAAKAPGLWVHTLIAKAEYARRFLGWDRIVVPDVRFRLEESMLRYWATAGDGRFVSLRVERPGLEPIRESDHASEREIELIPADRRIVNGEYGEFVTEVTQWAWDLTH